MTANLKELTGYIEDVTSESIKNNSGHEWNEDFITIDLLRNLRKELCISTMLRSDKRSNISWENYKLTGTNETNFGDISLVVNINYRDGTSINGVAFLEAKKRDWRKTTFGAMRQPQAKRIVRNAPRSQYLLYDYEDITGFLLAPSYPDQSVFYEHDSLIRDNPGSFKQITRALCVPINLAIATGDKDTLLYRHGLPLSHMITNRYFQGLDLEFDEISKQIATGHLKKKGLPKYIVKIDILEEDSKPTEQTLTINKSEYTKAD